MVQVKIKEYSGNGGAQMRDSSEDDTFAQSWLTVFTFLVFLLASLSSFPISNKAE